MAPCSISCPANFIYIHYLIEFRPGPKGVQYSFAVNSAWRDTLGDGWALWKCESGWNFTITPKSMRRTVNWACKSPWANAQRRRLPFAASVSAGYLFRIALAWLSLLGQAVLNQLGKAPAVQYDGRCCLLGFVLRMWPNACSQRATHQPYWNLPSAASECVRLTLISRLWIVLTNLGISPLPLKKDPKSGVFRHCDGCHRGRRERKSGILECAGRDHSGHVRRHGLPKPSTVYLTLFDLHYYSLLKDYFGEWS